MELKKISLWDFRNYLKKEFVFSSGTTLVVGPNTSGKTNLLEAIYLLATGRSFRAGIEKEMIAYGKEIARVKGEVVKEEEEELEIVLTTGQVREERVAKKRYFLNGVGKRMSDFIGQLSCVLFRPEDLEIVIDSPAIRRNYLDSVLEQADKEYRRASLSYQKGLRQRNKLLDQIREEGKSRAVLFFFNQLLVENGTIISQKREELIDFINAQPDYFYDLVVEYQKNIITPTRLQQYQEKEIGAGMTLVGPHRDDFVLQTKQKGVRPRSLHAFGSRGEQRTAIFSLKLAELEFMEEKTKTRPVLLLDDIFSELDGTRRKRLLEVIPRQQTIITTTELGLINKEGRKKIALITLNS
jgi:DNA replication and repair protein RecF